MAGVLALVDTFQGLPCTFTFLQLLYLVTGIGVMEEAMSGYVGWIELIVVGLVCGMVWYLKHWILVLIALVLVMLAVVLELYFIDHLSSLKVVVIPGIECVLVYLYRKGRKDDKYYQMEVLKAIGHGKVTLNQIPDRFVSGVDISNREISKALHALQKQGLVELSCECGTFGYVMVIQRYSLTELGKQALRKFQVRAV